MATNRTPLTVQEDQDYPTQHNHRELKVIDTASKALNVSDDFESGLVVSYIDASDGTEYTGASGEVLAMSTRKAHYEVYQGTVASPAIVTPYVSASGLELQPVAAGDALELTHGTTSRSRAAFTIGTDEDFYAEAKITIDDISSVTEMFFGFRLAEAYQQDPEDYNDMATIGVDGDGNVEIATILNDGTTSKTDTTTDWTDGDEFTLRVEVKKNGQCTFKIDGDEPSTTAGFTFDDGDVVLPFLHLNTESADPNLVIDTWKVGRL